MKKICKLTVIYPIIGADSQSDSFQRGKTRHCFCTRMKQNETHSAIKFWSPFPSSLWMDKLRMLFGLWHRTPHFPFTPLFLADLLESRCTLSAALWCWQSLWNIFNVSKCEMCYFPGWKSELGPSGGECVAYKSMNYIQTYIHIEVFMTRQAIKYLYGWMWYL